MNVTPYDHRNIGARVVAPARGTLYQLTHQRTRATVDTDRHGPITYPANMVILANDWTHRCRWCGDWRYRLQHCTTCGAT